MPSGIVTVDLEGRVVTLNPAAELLTGFFAGEVAGRYCTEVFRDSPIIGEILMETLASRSHAPGVPLALIRRNGASVPVEFSVAPLTGGDGKDLGVVGVLRDLTVVRELQRQLERSDRLAAVGTLAAGLAHEIKNPLTSLLTFTRHLTRRFDDSGFRDKFQSIVPRELERINGIVERLLELSRPARLTPSPVRVPALLDRAVELYSHRIEAQGVSVRREYAATVLPVAADEELVYRAFVNLVANALDAMEDGGPAHPARRLERRARARSRDSARTDWPPCTGGDRRHRHWHVGRSYRPHLHSVLHHQGAWNRARAGSDPQDHRGPRRLDHGEQHPRGGHHFPDPPAPRPHPAFSRPGSAVSDLETCPKVASGDGPTGSPPGDIQPDFLSLLVHDLRTLLTVAQGYLDLLDDGPRGDRTAAARYLRNMQACCTQMAGRISASRVPRPVDLAAVVASVAGRVVPAAGRRGIALEVSGTERPLRVLGNAARLDQVLVNLLGNALQFTPGGGTVAVAVRPVDGEIEVSVTDSGPGIPPEEIPLLFERFSQAEEGRCSSATSIGLGLLLCRQAIEAHGGRLWVESRSGQGARFVFRLERVADSASDEVHWAEF